MTSAVCLKKPAFYNPSFLEPSVGDAAVPKFNPPRISVLASVADMAEDMTASMADSGGVFELADLGEIVVAAPFPSIGELFRVMDARPDLGDRANAAYKNNLVYKNAYSAGNGGAGVDEKRVIDLSPARLDTIVNVDAALGEEIGAPLLDSVRFFDRVRTEVAPKLLEAVSQVVGDPTLVKDNMTNYRMVDYQPRPVSDMRDPSEHGPRCGAHRDFGTFTLIFPDGVAGLEVLLDEEKGAWRPVDVPAGSAVLLFGWCANVRSNDRVPAALHRVVDAAPKGVAGGVPQRQSAVFFLAPAPETALEPVIMPGEDAVYKTFTAGDLKGIAGRKWRYREGTLAEEKDRRDEEKEAEEFPTQDDIIGYLFKN